jgi:hypothetical protein
VHRKQKSIRIRQPQLDQKVYCARFDGIGFPFAGFVVSALGVQRTVYQQVGVVEGEHVDGWHGMSKVGSVPCWKSDV